MVKGGICNKIVITEMKYFLLDYDSYDVCYHWVMSPIAFVLSTWTFNDGLHSDHWVISLDHGFTVVIKCSK